MKKDEVVQARIETRYPTYNHKAHHEEVLE